MVKRLKATLEDIALLIWIVRGLRNWSAARLARRAGMDKGQVLAYQAGQEMPEPRSLARLFAGARVHWNFLERVLPWLREIRAAAVLEPGEPAEAERDEELAQRLGRIVTAVARPLLPRLRARLRRRPGPQDAPESSAEDELAARLCALLERLEPADRNLLIEGVPELHSPFLCKRLCEASAAAAADDAGKALDLAQRAVRVAQLAPGADDARSWREGWATGFLANARRVSNDVPGADRAFARARDLRPAGAPAPPVAEAGLFAEARLFDLEASLRCDQRRWAAAFSLLDRAFALAPAGDARARILMQKASTSEQKGEPEKALAALREAAREAGEAGDLGLLFGIHFNEAVALLHLHRTADAEPLVAEARQLAARLGSALHGARQRWLEGRLLAAQGRTEEASAALCEVQSFFIAERMPYDTALVTLELALLHAERGETAEVPALVLAAKPVFEANRIHREALACYRLLQEAAERQAVTAALARDLLDRLSRAT